MNTTAKNVTHTAVLLLKDECLPVRRMKSFDDRLELLSMHVADAWEFAALLDGGKADAFRTAQNKDEAWSPEGHRSMMVGDLCREYYDDGSHALFLCASFGWELLLACDAE